MLNIIDFSNGDIMKHDLWYVARVTFLALWVKINEIF
jgi:hypothetical protein